MTLDWPCALETSGSTRREYRQCRSPIADSHRTDIAVVAAAAALPATSSTERYSFSRTSRHRRNTTRVTGLHFEGFYRDKRTERYQPTLALSISIYSSSSRRSSSFTLESNVRLSIRDISSTLPTTNSSLSVPPFFLLLLHFFDLLYTPIVYTAKNTLRRIRVVFYFFALAKPWKTMLRTKLLFSHIVLTFRSDKPIRLVSHLPPRISTANWGKEGGEENIESLWIRLRE